jgi:hypothetical protein
MGKQSLDVFRSIDGTRLISLKSANKTLGYDGKSKNWPFEFLTHLNRLMPASPVLLESTSQEIVADDNGHLTPAIAAKDFTELCQTISAANHNGFLYVSEQKFAKSAAAFLKDIGSHDLETVIDFVTGYERFKQNHKALVAKVMQEISGMNYPVWVKAFPDEFFEIVLAFQNDGWADLNKQSGKYATLFNDLIFSRLGDDTFDFLELTKPKMRYSRQFEVENYRIQPALQAHLLEVAALLRTAALDAAIFNQMLSKRFPVQRVLAQISRITSTEPIVSNDLMTENLQIAVSKKID